MSEIRDRAIKKVAKRLSKFERGWEMKWIELSSDGRQDYINEAEKILSIPELAIVDREAELPVVEITAESGDRKSISLGALFPLYNWIKEVEK